MTLGGHHSDHSPSADSSSIGASNSTNQTGSSIGGDFSTCDREPIQIPGSIQPHGCLLALRPSDLIVLQLSVNTLDALKLLPERIHGHAIDDLLPSAIVRPLREAVNDQTLGRNALYLGQCQLEHAGYSQRLSVTAHLHNGVVIVEMETSEGETNVEFSALYAMVRDFVGSLQHAPDARRLAALASAEVRRLTGFDRVLVYQFDEEWNGTTIGESLDPDAYAPYLDLRFPASDIPRQARELYRLNRLRLIVDANYNPVPLLPAMNPLDNKPLDLSFAALRSVSPVHVQYLKNMNAMASMSISILRDGQLWGLIACHHRQPLKLSFEVRTACDFIGQVLSVQLEARQLANDSDERVKMRSLQTLLLASIASGGSVKEGLIANQTEMLQFANADGAILAMDDAFTLIGTTPNDAECRQLVNWLAEHVDAVQDVWSTDALAELFPEGRDFTASAAGVLAIRISKLHRSFIIWLRTEVVQTVKWGGDPKKIITYENGIERLHPRTSFELWKETVRGRSLRWKASQIEAALEMRNAIVGIVLRKAEEMASLSAELENSNRELEAFSYSVSHDLRAPFRHIVGYAELLKVATGEKLDAEQQRYLETIMESARYAGRLVDNLLSFSQMGRAALNLSDVGMNELARTVRLELNAEVEGSKIDWRIGNLPEVHADRMMMRLVVRNLLENAVKYSRKSANPTIEFAALPTETSPDGVREHVFFVRDNGVGFDMAYAAKLFGVFQRLHRMEEYEGTGIGLANVRRIVSRHGGRTWAVGAPGQGATFYFTIPVTPNPTVAEKTTS